MNKKKKHNKERTEKQELTQELKQLVIARLNLIPSGVKLSVGSEGEYTRKELIKRVQEGDAVGQQIAHSQLEFLRALGAGRLIDELVG